MASGDWFKAIISRKSAKPGRLKQLKQGPPKELPTGSKERNKSNKSSKMFYNGSCDRLSIENVAATHIQAAYRGYLARKKLHYIRKTKGLQVLAKRDPIKRQTSITLRYIQSWSKVQAEIGARRVCMVKEGLVKQKKQENQLKLEAKLHDLEVEWCGGSETMEEILSRIHQREEAAVKRERAMAYAFSHQWKAHPGINFGQFSYAFEKENWCWSWMERWISARPWELRESFSQKSQPKASINTVKSTNQPNRRAVGLVKPPLSTSKVPSQKKPQIANEKAVTHEQNHTLVPTETGDVINYPLHARVMETEGGR